MQCQDKIDGSLDLFYSRGTHRILTNRENIYAEFRTMILKFQRKLFSGNTFHNGGAHVSEDSGEIFDKFSMYISFSGPELCYFG